MTRVSWWRQSLAADNRAIHQISQYDARGTRLATTPSMLTETTSYRAAIAELSRTMTRRQVETLVRFVMRSALDGCVHSWIADEGGRKFGVRAELVRGLLAV